MYTSHYFLFYLYLDWEHCVAREQIKAIANEIHPSRVVCIDRPGDLLVGLLRRRKRLRSSLPGANIRKINDNLTLIRPFFFLNDYLASWIPCLNRLQCEWLRWLLKQMGYGPASNERVITWLCSPVHWPFAKLFPSAFVVYQLVDEYTLTAQGCPNPHRAAMEQLMLKKSNIVFTRSEALARKKSSWHKNVFCIGQGVPFDHFAKALRCRTEVPSELANIPKPRIGLVGNLRDWIDFQLVKRLLESHPEWSVVFIGPIDSSAASSVATLTKFRNFFWVGAKSFKEIPRWLSGLDVGIIPYLQTEFTMYVNPAKLYEYWAAGLPVVMTNIGEFKSIEGCLWIAESASQFIEATNQALQIGGSFREKRIQIARDHSFENVAKRALKHLSI